MQPFYSSAYFFSAKIWQEMQLVSIELRKVYRQNDARFIGILDRIRENAATTADIQAVNSRVGAVSMFLQEPIPSRLRWPPVAIRWTISTTSS